MSRSIRVRAGDAVYPVRIGPGELDTAGENVARLLETDRVVVVADATVARLHGRRLRRGFRAAGVRIGLWLDIPPGERSKSLARARALYDAFVEAGVDRWTPVVAFGGGVVGDLAGFAASTFMRGLPLVQIPTTVVAQVDSAVGGKTAVNFAAAKNLIGTFHQPRLVIADPSLLATLPARDFRAGLAEAVKIGVTLRPDLLEHLEANAERILDRDADALAPVVTACVEAKGEVVSRDEKEQDVRAILNYGHTVGHALESEARGALRHGEAVAIGMRAAAWVGETLGVSVGEVGQRQDALLTRLGLKLTRESADKRVIARKLSLDKKVRGKRTRFVLTLQVGGASVWPHIPGPLLRRAVAFVTA